MSNASLFPKEEGTSQNSDHADEVQFKRPEFVLIDDRQGKGQYTHFGSDDNEQAERKKSASKEPISLRFICLLGFIFCLIFGLGMLLWSIVMTTLATLSLFQNKKFNQGMKSFWKIFANTAIAGFGFTLGLINPTLGLGLVALYFSISGDLVGDDFLRKVIKSAFKQF